MILYHKVLGNGSPLIILHGIFGSSDNWGIIGKALSGNFKVYLVDLRNHGRSFHHQDFNYKVMVEDLIRFISHHGLKKVALLGHSMGGKVAMETVMNYPRSVSGLIVVDIAPRAYPVHHDGLINSLLSLDLSSIKSRNEADQMLSKSIQDQAVRQFLLKNLTRNKQGFGWKLNLPVIAKNLNQVGKGLEKGVIFKKPTLFISGDQSDYILPSDRLLIKNHFPDSTLIKVKQAGHWVHADQPEILAEIVMQFLKSETNSFNKK